MLPIVGIALMRAGMPSVPVRSFGKKKLHRSRAKEVHRPDAHASLLGPQLFPFGAKLSGGQAGEFPVHISVVSQVGSCAGRQTCVAGAN